jgi:phosphomannomutase
MSNESQTLGSQELTAENKEKSGGISPELLQLCQDWLALDPDPNTRASLEADIESVDSSRIQAAFSERLVFGTAGIRGEMGYGCGRMNRVMVRQATAGFAAYLLQNLPQAAEHGVVVGCDARHNSRTFAEDTAAVLLAYGFRVWLHDGVVATPSLAFSVTQLGAAGGVMVTASHNPPADNGYKVYWNNGAQIVPPHDRGIEAEIRALVERGGQTPLANLEVARASGRLLPVLPEVETEYVRRVLALRVHPGHPMPAVYTAMHGVGWAPLQRLLSAAGQRALIATVEQVEPDGDFPTVAFPNPEEKGALDLAQQTANARGARLILANDPDADRLAVAVPWGSGWRQLTGNEVGLLLAADLLEYGSQDGERLVAASIVSSPLLARIAEELGAECVWTLTGFKWIANAALAFESGSPGGRFILGFEEALGYSAGSVVRDKDGLSAALLLLDLAGWCEARGSSLSAHLEGLYRRFGLAGSCQRSVKVKGADFLARMAQMMEALRSAGAAELGGRSVVTFHDLKTGRSVDGNGHPIAGLGLPSSDVLVYELGTLGEEQILRVIVRPSGTEPKVKVYVDRVVAIGSETPLASAQSESEALMGAIADGIAAELEARLSG